jgi:hypothetical protein
MKCLELTAERDQLREQLAAAKEIVEQRASMKDIFESLRVNVWFEHVSIEEI